MLSNVLGTVVVLEACRRHHVRCLFTSTDEVYGDSDERGTFTEDLSLSPSSPYSWSKASADLYVSAQMRTYAADQPQIVVTRACNHFGPRQQWEKFVPRVIMAGLEGEPAKLYGDGEQIRTWIYVRDGARALYHVMQYGQVGAVYNIAPCMGLAALTNHEMARLILGLVVPDKEPEIQLIPDRPGHDRAYLMHTQAFDGINPAWQQLYDLKQGLQETVAWYASTDNLEWVRASRDRDNAFCQKNYAERG